MNKQRADALKNMLDVGGQMSNRCFNLAQHQAIEKGHRETMKTLQAAWDLARRRFFASLDPRDRLRP